MDDIKILDAVERYIRGEMNPDERLYFENLRKTNPEVDQLVVEHTLFLQQMNRFGEWKKFRSGLHDIHTDLAEQGKINSGRLQGKAKIIYLWKRYKRVAAIAAVIAGITTLVISALVWAVSPKTPAAEIEVLKNKIHEVDNKVDRKTSQQDQKINSFAKNLPAPNPIVYTTGGTGFIIDIKGYLLTNAHVVEGAHNVAVQNKRGDFIARVVFTDAKRDIAILKIDDDGFKAFTSIPYAISRSSAELADPIFTLGYPRKEIVYGQGYLSSKTGYNGDTLSCQIDIAANRGNSGSPILNKSGEVIGILNGRQTNTEGFAFAIQSKYIYRVFEEMKKDNPYQKLKLPVKSSLAGLDFPQQVKKIEDYVFRVKVN